MNERATPGSNQPRDRPAEQSDAQKMMLYDVNKKSLVISYVLWFFLGFLGAHRFYLRQTGSAWGMIALWVFSLIFLVAVPVLGIVLAVALGVWLLVDIFLIIGMVKGLNQEVIARINHGTLR